MFLKQITANHMAVKYFIAGVQLILFIFLLGSPFEKPCFIITCHLVEEQNEVECKGDEESQEAQVVEIARQIILEEKVVYLLDAVRIKIN